MKKVRIEASISWRQAMDAVLESFEANADDWKVFAGMDAKVLRHIAEMIEKIIEDGRKAEPAKGKYFGTSGKSSDDK